MNNITESQAILQQERIKQIMADTGCTFAQACDQYIMERYPLEEPTIILAGHD